MRADNISDLPFPIGTSLTLDQLPVLRAYNRHDVLQTIQFYHHSTESIRFREELTARYQRDFMNHNDTKIGKDYFVMELEAAGVQCYDYGPQGRQPGRPGARASRSRTPSCRGSRSRSPSSNGCWSGSRSRRSPRPRGVQGHHGHGVEGSRSCSAWVASTGQWRTRFWSPMRTL